MSFEYDNYLNNHKRNVKKAYEWFRENMPGLFEEPEDYEWVICVNHDSSKTSQAEYDAYDEYFYGGNKSFDVTQRFNKAWLHHAHHNEHHWQHWVLPSDDPEEMMIELEIPHIYVIEMICDWWSFGWKSGDLKSIFEWYNHRKDYIILNHKTKKKVDSILTEMKMKLEG